MPEAKPKPCGRCGEIRRVMFWPGSYVCLLCHRSATTETCICSGCGVRGLTPGTRNGEGYLCLSCTDPAELGTALCHFCWSELRGFMTKSCTRCRLRRLLDQLLADGDGVVRPELGPVADALVARPNAEATIQWVRKPGVMPNLRLLAEGAVPVSHEGLNSLKPWRPIALLRDMLMEHGVLPHVDRYVAQFERWLAEFLADQPDPGHRKILEQFATWHQLRRLRSEAGRRVLVRERIDTDKTVLRRAADFLDWLAEQRLSVETCRQPDLDRWAAGLRARPHVVSEVLPFLRWCMDQRRMSHLIVVSAESDNPAPISQAARLAMIRELLLGEGFPLVERVVSLLVLLYAQPVARIVRIRVDDVLQEPDGVFLRLGAPASPVPEPVDELLLRLLRDRPSLFPRSDPGSPWLLPGQRAGQPMTPNYIRKRINAAGVPNLSARTAALRELVLQAPASVVAGMIGIHPVHAALVTKQAGTEWSRYAAGDHSRGRGSERAG